MTRLLRRLRAWWRSAVLRCWTIPVWWWLMDCPLCRGWGNSRCPRCHGSGRRFGLWRRLRP